nr:RNA recognition motif domain protein [Cedratvirus plubellavi]
MEDLYQTSPEGDLYFKNPNQVLQLERIRVEGSKILVFHQGKDEPSVLSSKESFNTKEDKEKEIARLVQLNQTFTREHLESLLFCSTFSLQLSLVKSRQRRKLCKKITKHPLFRETKSMLEQVVGEELTDDEASIVIHMHNRGRLRLVKDDFTEREWSLHSLSINNMPKRPDSGVLSKYEEYMYNIYNQ